MSKGKVRVRFAPSPTGFLHVGGARTAIFNWLFARHTGGKFLIRIEDTDPERSKGELSEQIVRTMKWLGMEPDEPIVYQSDRIQRYRDVVMELVELGKAYYSFETPEELEAMRKEAALKKVPFKYNRGGLKIDKLQISDYMQEGKAYTIRFLVPEGETRWKDIVHGETVFKNSEIDDFVLLRSDGSPVYQIAVVVDDHDMGITHVIRGDDHLSNTPKQILLYKALGWDVPEFAHLPMILDEQKRKLSKRRNPVAVEEYRDRGYLPEAMFNFLALLGSPSPKERVSSEKWEIALREEWVRNFSLEKVNKKPAVFDWKKLDWMNSEYIRMTSDESLVEKLRSLKVYKVEEYTDEYLKKVVRLMKERVNTINDFYGFGKYFFEEPEKYDGKGLEKYGSAEDRKLLEEYLRDFSTQRHRVTEEYERHLRYFAERKGVKAGKIIHPLRLALTGMTVSPGIFEVMEILGRESVMRRIKKFLKVSESREGG